MKTRIGTTFGLALLLVLGALVTLGALGRFDPGLVLATHDDTDCVGGDCNVTSVEVEADPNDPGVLESGMITVGYKPGEKGCHARRNENRPDDRCADNERRTNRDHSQ